MSSDLLLDTKGVPEATKAIADLGKRARNATRDTSYRVRTIYRRAEQRRFDEQGPGWTSLAESTRERKSREGLDPRALRASGKLYRSLTSVAADGQLDERTEDEMRFGTTVWYARFHDKGEGVPERKLIELTISERAEINRAVQSYIARGRT